MVFVEGAERALVDALIHNVEERLPWCVEDEWENVYLVEKPFSFAEYLESVAFSVEGKQLVWIPTHCKFHVSIVEPEGYGERSRVWACGRSLERVREVKVFRDKDGAVCK